MGWFLKSFQHSCNSIDIRKLIELTSKLIESLLVDVHCILVIGPKQVKRTVIYKQKKSFRTENGETDCKMCQVTDYVIFYVCKRN